AKLIYLKNGDTNKVFSINFRTPPNDNSGVNHVIEHCLLDGSKNYPVKSMFTAMDNQSLKTYLNAGTCSDYTNYTAASKNEKDFMNLMSVYMDAVFYPNVLTNKKIFQQEAGHYELDSPKSELTYSGVVFNEIKAPEDTFSLMNQKIARLLLPDTTAVWDSGGRPAEMMNLTYEKLVKTYKKFYHPSNCYIYLYGDINLDETLKFLDSAYLKKFSRKVINSGIKLQKPLAKSIEKTYEYNVPKNSTLENKTCLSWNCVVDKTTNAEVSKAFEMLISLLFEGDALFKKALDAKGFGDIYYSFGSGGGMAQPVFSIICENGHENQRAAFKKAVETELKKAVEKGFNKKTIASLIHYYKVKPFLDETSYSSRDRGINLNNKIMQMWVYGGDPFIILDYDMNINILERTLKNNYLEKLIEKYLTNNTHKATIELKPKPVLEGNEIDPLEKQLEEHKSKFSADEINEIIKQANDLKKWQMEPDSEEAISKLPVLEPSDLKKCDIMLAPNIEEVNGCKILYTMTETNDMNYMDFYFDTSTVPQDKLPYINILAALVGHTDTEKYSCEDLQNEIRNKTADFNMYTGTFGKMDSTSEYNPKMQLMLSTLDSDMDAAIELLNQLITKSKFNNKVLLKNLIHEQKIQAESLATSNYMGFLRFNSYISEKDRYFEGLNGRPYYGFISDLDKNFEEKYTEIQVSITEVYKKVFNKNNLILGFVGSSNQYSVYKDKLSSFFKGMNDEKPAKYKYEFPVKDVNEGLISTQSTNSVTKGYNIKKLGYEYNGSMAVLETILNEYLYNNVRAAGEAYDARVETFRNGNVIFDSARDPHIRETLDCFDSAASFLRSFKADKRKMMNYIIGTIARIDSGAYATTNIISEARISQELHIKGETPEALQKERDEILGTTDEDIRALADVIDDVIKQNCFCVAGTEADINHEKDIFNSIINLSE
ncbi:MAG TPA: insulinase family protein, partial [Clostridia bacterium]|nr:insulinase family protein [Clostridia bacterium]